MEQFAHQADAVLAQAAPVQNTWYTVLNTTTNVRIIRIYANVALANETVQGQITIDGVTVAIPAAVFVAGTGYFVRWAFDLTDSLYWDVNEKYVAFLIEGKSVKVEIRKTTANGVGTLTCKVGYARRV